MLKHIYVGFHLLLLICILLVLVDTQATRSFYFLNSSDSNL